MQAQSVDAVMYYTWQFNCRAQQLTMSTAVTCRKWLIYKFHSDCHYRCPHWRERANVDKSGWGRINFWHSSRYLPGRHHYTDACCQLTQPPPAPWTDLEPRQASQMSSFATSAVTVTQTLLFQFHNTVTNIYTDTLAHAILYLFPNFIKVRMTE